MLICWTGILLFALDGWLASWTEWSDRLSDTFLCSCLIFCRLLLIINITMEFCLFQSDSYVRTPMAVLFLYEEFFFSCCGWTIWRSANTNIISWNNIWRLLYKWSKIMTRICSTTINRIPRSGLHVLYGFQENSSLSHVITNSLGNVCLWANLNDMFGFRINISLVNPTICE